MCGELLILVLDHKLFLIRKMELDIINSCPNRFSETGLGLLLSEMTGFIKIVCEHNELFVLCIDGMDSHREFLIPRNKVLFHESLLGVDL
jgi:hypothetical protein